MIRDVMLVLGRDYAGIHGEIEEKSATYILYFFSVISFHNSEWLQVIVRVKWHLIRILPKYDTTHADKVSYKLLDKGQG